MKQEIILKLVDKVKRHQRKDAINPDSLVRDKLFNMNQMADAFDKYLDWLKELIKKEYEKELYNQHKTEVKFNGNT